MVGRNNYLSLVSTARGIIGQLLKDKKTIAILINGSAVWGSESLLNKSSDVDLDIIISGNSIPSLRNSKTPAFDSFRKNFTRLFSNCKLDYASWKLITPNGCAGLHFVPVDIFKLVCNYPYVKSTHTLCLREYRMYPKEKPPVYLQRNFGGQLYEYVCGVDKIKEGYITQIPLVIIKNGQYFNGLLADKYLTYPVIVDRYQNVKIRLYLANLKKNLFLRLKKEQSLGLVGKTANLGNLPHAKDRMPRYELRHLRLETKMMEYFY